MTIKQQGGIFGRNPSFNDVTVTNTTTTDLTVADGDITLSKSGTTSGLITQGAISEGANRMALGNGDTGVWFLDNLESIVPFNPAAGTSRGSEINLGYSSIPFANLYLSGNVKVGDGSGIDFSATSGTGTSELFSDYEEGTWTPAQGSGVTVTGSFASSGKYTKVGRVVTLIGQMSGSTNIAVSAGSELTPTLPFTPEGTSVSVGSLTTGAVSQSNSVAVSYFGPKIFCMEAITTTASAIHFTVTYFTS